MRHTTFLRTFSSKVVFGTGLAIGLVTMSAPSLLAQQADPQATPAPETQARHHHGNPAEHQEKMLEHMTKALSLSPDQVSQVKSIQADTMSQQQALRSDTDKSDRRSKMMDLHKSERDKIRNVLNDDQKAKFDAMAEHHKEHMKGGQEQTPPAA